MINKTKRHTCIYCNRKRFETDLMGFKFTTWITPVKQITTIHFVCTDTSPGWLIGNSNTCQSLVYDSNQRTNYFFFNL